MNKETIKSNIDAAFGNILILPDSSDGQMLEKFKNNLYANFDIPPEVENTPDMDKHFQIWIQAYSEVVWDTDNWKKTPERKEFSASLLWEGEAQSWEMAKDRYTIEVGSMTCQFVKGSDILEWGARLFDNEKDANAEVFVIEDPVEEVPETLEVTE